MCVRVDFVNDVVGALLAVLIVVVSSAADSRSSGAVSYRACLSTAVSRACEETRLESHVYM